MGITFQLQARPSVILIALLTIGCDRTSTTSTPPPPSKFSLVISADTAGWITPCGCTSNQSGGLLRRGPYLADLRKPASADVLYADAGGAAGGVSDYHRAKFEAILAGEIKL